MKKLKKKLNLQKFLVIQSLKKYNKVIEIQEQNIAGPKLETEILKLSEEQCFLRNIILNETNKLFQTQLVYRYTRDGYSFDSFYRKVDFISPLIIIVEMESGLKIGTTAKHFMKSFKYEKSEKRKLEIIKHLYFVLIIPCLGLKMMIFHFFNIKKKLNIV